MQGLSECKNIRWILWIPLGSRWLAGHWQDTASLSSMNPQRFSTGLNKSHAPISRIKPFEHLLSLIFPLFVLRCVVTVNDFLKICFFFLNIQFTCLKCLVELTHVCKATITGKQNQKSVWAEPRHLISKLGWSRGNRQGISILPFSFSWFTYLDCAVIPSRENHRQLKQLYSPTPTRAQALHRLPPLSFSAWQSSPLDFSVN